VPSKAPPDPATIAAAILDLVQSRSPGKTICPSEVARRLAPTAWRALMPAVRAAAARLQNQGLIIVTQRGRPVDPLAAKGPIRLGLSPPGDRPRD
jgi:hypothetical protein